MRGPRTPPARIRWRASTGSTRGPAALRVYFLGRTSNPEAALDLSQEAFLRAWRNAPTLRALSPERQRYWLSAVAKNLVVDRHRGLVSRRGASHRAAADPLWTRNREAGPQAALASRERLEDADQELISVRQAATLRREDAVRLKWRYLRDRDDLGEGG